MSDTAPGQPYGPSTAALRHFLVALAALDVEAHARVCARYEAVASSAAFHAADTALGDAVERSGRHDARDALAGPLIQLLRAPGDTAADATDDELPLDPIAEPALAAALALLVRDLLPATHFDALYAPFALDAPAPPPER